MARKILIIDSSSMIAMRLKVLLVHFAMFDENTDIDIYDLLIFSQGVPTDVVSIVVEKATSQSFFIEIFRENPLFDAKRRRWDESE
ncbi:hypothetical protein LOC50_01855 [Pseudoalteromonas sp. SCSIO 43095]|uniref:hypothetical protein n=1 Tax=Pseudoalteromonas sp. SCSIO 43095 TaxID=2894202 RepID=UPI00202ADD74|nr:hypothetical protein [Pseudoalteromonas sp. SCSIO 43095]URQ99081.1 hypothetical protein LOC50_01855 [Pseudoalteromonas sp. SCSIO 43095]